MLALSSLAAAQNPWVNRRKNKDKDAPVAADPAAGDTDFSKLNDMVKNLQQAGAAGGQGEDMFAGMGADSASVSERFRTSSRVDGVVAMPHRRDALVMIIRASTRLVSARRPCCDAVVRRRLQNAMMQAMGGEQFWESKKLELSMQKEDERKREANREAREKAEAYKYREDQVRRHMGSIKYYLMPKNRAKYYEVYPLPKKYRLMEEQERANAKREKQLAEMRKKQKAAQ